MTDRPADVAALTDAEREALIEAIQNGTQDEWVDAIIAARVAAAEQHGRDEYAARIAAVEALQIYQAHNTYGTWVDYVRLDELHAALGTTTDVPPQGRGNTERGRDVQPTRIHPEAPRDTPQGAGRPGVLRGSGVPDRAGSDPQRRNADEPVRLTGGGGRSDPTAARLAAVEALADEWAALTDDANHMRDAADRIRAALDTAAAPTSATVRADAGRLALLEMADEIDRGPTFPLPPSVISALIRERAEAIRERAEAAGDDHA